MKLVVGFLVIFMELVFGRVDQSSAQYLTAEPSCSSNASAAWVDVVLLIDNSINMGASNLNKAKSTIKSAFSNFPIGNNDQIKQGFHNTRVGIVTFNYEASIVAQFTDINNGNDLSRILDGIQISNRNESNLYDALISSLYVKWNCSGTVSIFPDDCPNDFRPVAFVMFTASPYPKINQKIPPMTGGTGLFDTDILTYITVNFNANDKLLATILNEITYNPLVKASMYNFSGDSDTLVNDLEWALLQGSPTILYDSSKNRYSRYAECPEPVTYQGVEYDNTIDVCKHVYVDISYEAPGYILSKEKELFVESLAVAYPYILPLYIGYHKNSASNWGSGYTNWGAGYPQNNNMNCTVIDSTDMVTFKWKNVLCDPQYSKVNNVLCQNYFCDAEHTDCIKYYRGL
uniref:Uncharacterized protein n=1 Tax=Acrobeloides nanus TaxID=290746 RepID=A0A914DBR7_9BILA